MSDRKGKRARRDTVPATNKARIENETRKQLKPRPTPPDPKAVLGALAVQVAERTGLALGPRFTADEMQMLDAMVSMARDAGRVFDLRSFASVLLRGSARDYGDDSEAWGPQAQKLERHAWLFVRERLAFDREHGCNMRDTITEALLQHLDMTIERLK